MFKLGSQLSYEVSALYSAVPPFANAYIVVRCAGSGYARQNAGAVQAGAPGGRFSGGWQSASVPNAPGVGALADPSASKSVRTQRTPRLPDHERPSEPSALPKRIIAYAEVTSSLVVLISCGRNRVPGITPLR